MPEVVAVPGVSTLGVRVAWAPGTANALPSSSSLTWFTRINTTSEITVTPETIDASALEDYEDKSVAGRASNGGTYTVTVNETDATQTEWAAAFAASASGTGIWIQEYVPGLTQGNWIFVQTPRKYPKSGKAQNGLLTVEIPLTIVNYWGYDTLVAPPTVEVTGVTLNKSTLSLAVEGEETLVATVAPSNADDQTVTWISSDTSKATVTSGGKVVGVAAGTATITVTASGNHTATCTVTVTS